MVPNYPDGFDKFDLIMVGAREAEKKQRALKIMAQYERGLLTLAEAITKLVEIDSKVEQSYEQFNE